MDKTKLKQLASAVIETEIRSIALLKARIDDDFVRACELMLDCKGRIIVLGMGKSGHIGNKIAATLASTGSPAFFVHPGEASHGDLGMITANDVVLAISNSGETDEIITILPIIKRLHVPLIAMTGKQTSTIAESADVQLNIGIEEEACPLGLAPTSSTTATLVMGDALAVALLEARGFTADDFARSHPGGRLGRRLLLHVADVMRVGSAIPTTSEEASFHEALLEMTKKGLGMTIIVDDNNKVAGLITDGDLRRLFDGETDMRDANVKDVMTAKCKTVPATILAAEALRIMEEYKVNSFPVVDVDNNVVGAFNMHDLLKAGVV
ncbi:MAG: KpsF/GutQ family sugar-phosphate isomerase [Gammaproteobacteria bacterium]|nr:KpsF/GutQ family sugar-phosphate isomerase [Gammaproteobacteria bacterium]